MRRSPITKPELRRDLRSILVDGRRRTYRIVVDEVSGRFARVSEHVWQSLVDGQYDPQLWQEARAAGWTRERTQARRQTFSPLYFRIPVGTVDGIASQLAPHSGILFSVVAVLIWTAVIAVAAVLALSHGAELFASLGSLQRFLRQADPLWLGMPVCRHQAGPRTVARGDVSPDGITMRKRRVADAVWRSLSLL